MTDTFATVALFDAKVPVTSATSFVHCVCFQTFRLLTWSTALGRRGFDPLSVGIPSNAELSVLFPFLEFCFPGVSYRSATAYQVMRSIFRRPVIIPGSAIYGVLVGHYRLSVLFLASVVSVFCFLTSRKRAGIQLDHIALGLPNSTPSLPIPSIHPSVIATEIMFGIKQV